MTTTTAVLGGGLSGLSAAYYLLRRLGPAAASSSAISVFESSNRLGGWIRTERQRDRGFVFEAGPRTIRPKALAGANTLELIDELQLPVDRILSSHAAARNRMIYAKGQLCMLPNSLGGMLRTRPPFTRPLLSALLTDMRAAAKKLKHDDESIYDFAARRFGVEIADYAISPMICGICAGDAREISVRFLMNDIFEKEQRYGGVIKGLFLSRFMSDDKLAKSSSSGGGGGGGIFADGIMPPLYERARSEKWAMYGLQNGLETLPRALGTYLRERNVDIQLSTECRALTFAEAADESGNTALRVRLNVKGHEQTAQHVVCALPSHKLAGCLKDQHPSLAAQLLAIPYVDVAVVNLQYNVSDLQRHKAFGFLVPPVERLPILGVIYDSCCFDMHGNTVLTVMMGGRWFEQHFGKCPSQKELLDTALNEVRRIIGITEEPRMTRVHILKQCIPQYTVGHRQRVADIRRYIARYKLPLTLCGAAYDGVGINDVILSARQQVSAATTLNA